MAERLSRERIAELRASRKPLTWAELMALLDAYEAQRKCPGTVDSCTSTAVLERIKVALDRPGVSQSYVDWARECRAAWEAQRPRPASEPPQRAGLYLALVCDDGYFWTVSWAYGGSEGWVGDNIVAWLPLPPAPERDDG